MGKIKALIDTNVLLDHLAHRNGFFQDAAVIFSMVDEGKLIGIVSSLSIVITRDKKGFNDLDILVMTLSQWLVSF